MTLFAQEIPLLFRMKEQTPQEYQNGLNLFTRLS